MYLTVNLHILLLNYNIPNNKEINFLVVHHFNFFTVASEYHINSNSQHFSKIFKKITHHAL